MKRRSVQQAFEGIRPDEAGRERMLRNILLSSEIPPAGKDGHMKVHKLWRFVMVAAIIVVLTGTVAVASGFLKVPVKETAAFVSNDGTVEFYLDIDTEVTGEVVPRVEVVPHFFTGEEAKHIATVLFGDATFYEEEPFETVVYSKAEIQEKLDRWEDYTTVEALRSLYANQQHATDSYLEDALEIVNKYMAEYTDRLQSAPVDIQHTPCQWKLRSAVEYMFPEEEWDEHDAEHNNWEVSAKTVFNGLRYSFAASQRNNADFRVNNIHASIYSGISPNGIDQEIYKAQLCRTSEPTQEQIDAVKQKSETWLSEMKMGSWMVDECYVRSYGSGDTTEYYICVNAVPTFYGVPAIRRDQLTALRGRVEGETYYYYTDVQFEFAPNGELIYFRMYSPVDIVDIESEQESLPVEELLEIAKEKLMDSSATNYSYIPVAYEGMLDVGCRITVKDIGYSLTRTTDVDDRNPFVYSLGASLSGSVEYYDKETGEILDYTENRILLVLDGMDGAFIGRG